MKKIGILTFQWANNFGAIMQALALFDWLKENIKDYEIFVINYKSIPSCKVYSPFKFWKTGSFLRSCLSFVYHFPNNFVTMIKYDIFRKKYLNLSKNINRQDLEKNEHFYDIYICGSDQVRNLDLVPDDYFIYNLSFVHDKKKISYAASLGNLSYNDTKFNKLLNGVKEIDFLSVREKSSSDFLKKILNREVVHVCDPTFLLKRDYWFKMEKMNNFKLKNFIFVYYVTYNPYISKAIIKIKQLMPETKIIVAPSKLPKSLIRLGCKGIDIRSPEEYLSYFKNSNFVISCSFHGTVFSVLFKKKFYTISPLSNPSRVNDLCKQIGLEDRIISCQDDIDKMSLEEVDYGKSDILLEKFVNESKEFLLNSIYN